MPVLGPNITHHLIRLQLLSMQHSAVFSDAAEEVELKKPNHLTRHQLRHFDVKASLSTIYAEFAVS